MVRLWAKAKNVQLNQVEGESHLAPVMRSLGDASKLLQKMGAGTPVRQSAQISVSDHARIHQTIEVRARHQINSSDMRSTSQI